jgi:hypothetical protein
MLKIKYLLGSRKIYNNKHYYMAKKKDRKWMQRVSKEMREKGTEGAFTRYCGGKVTEECIQRGLRSPNPKTRARARLARTFRKYSKETGGEVSESTVDFLTNMKETFINSLSDASLMHLVKDIEEAYRKNQAYDKINMFAGELLTRRYGGNVKRYQEGGAMQSMMPEQTVPQQQAPVPQQLQTVEGQPDITYEQYVQFIISYPEYLDRFLQDVEAAKQMLEQQGAEGQPVGQEQQTVGEEPAI